MGTPAFGAVSLQKLIDSRHEVIAVFTQPDKPSGRGNKLVMSPVKELACRYGIPVYQPEKISRECVELLSKLNPDACVTAAFGQFLSEALLAIPKYGTINVHASLLPKHRGSAPINWAIINGDEKTGITTMFTVRKMDAGDILLKKERQIGNETAGEMTDLLAADGAELLLETLERIENGDCPRTPQNEEEMTYEPMMTKETGRIDWTAPADRVKRLIQGTSPWPGAYTVIGGQMLKIWKAEVCEGNAGPGTIIEKSAKQGLTIACGENAVHVIELQVQGGKRMDAKSYLLGHQIIEDRAEV
jgi:methionyl-tRNA formyltransferase